MLRRTWYDQHGSTALITHTIPSVMPSRSAIDRARSSFRWGWWRVFTWSNESTGRPASRASRRAFSAICSVVAFAYDVKSFNGTPWDHKNDRAPSCLYRAVRYPLKIIRSNIASVPTTRRRCNSSKRPTTHPQLTRQLEVWARSPSPVTPPRPDRHQTRGLPGPGLVAAERSEAAVGASCAGYPAERSGHTGTGQVPTVRPRILLGPKGWQSREDSDDQPSSWRGAVRPGRAGATV